MPGNESNELSAKIAALEKPVARFSFERWKFSITGTFIGTVAGSIAAFVIPKETVKNNKFLNRWFQPDNMTENIYPSSVAGLLSWVGAIAGGITDIVRDLKRPSEKEYFEEIAALKQQASGLSSQDSTGDDPTTRMQDMVSSRHQEVTSQRTR